MTRSDKTSLIAAKILSYVILSLSNLTTLSLNSDFSTNFTMYAETPKQFNKTYRIQIAHTEQEIDIIIWMGVFCGHKTGFVRPGHI